MSVTTIAKTLWMRYDPSEIDCFKKVKLGTVSEKGWLNGGKVIGGGYGTYITALPSHFILKVEIQDKKYEVWTERLFKKGLNISRLTEKVRALIERTMPQEIELERRVGRGGTEYWVIADSSLQSWLGRIREISK